MSSSSQRSFVVFLSVVTCLILSAMIGCSGGGGGGGTVSGGSPVGPLVTGATAELRGNITDNGRPVANAAVYLIDPARAFAAGLPRIETPLRSVRASVVYDNTYGDFRTLTDTAGQFVFPQVPADIDYTLVAVHDATRQTIRTGVRAVNAQVINVVLTPTGSLSGVARLSAPPANSHAGILAYLEGTSHVAITGDDGRFTLSSVPVGAYALRVQYNGFTPQIVPVTILPAQTASPATVLTLQPVPATAPSLGGLSGVVTRSPRLAGDSDDSGILVHLANTTFVTFTTANGAWQMSGAAPGPYPLAFPSEAYVVGSPPAASLTVTVRAGVVTTAPTVVLTPRTQPILLGDYVGHVTKAPAVPGDTDGAGVLVQLSGPTGSFLIGTDANGRFEFRRIPQGAYTLSLPDSRYRLAAGPTSVTIGAVLAATVPEFAVTPQNAALTLAEFAGVVVKSPPLAGDSDNSGVLVQLSGSGIGLTTVSGLSGRFEFHGIPSGTYALSFNDARYQLTAGTVAVAVTATSVAAIPDAQLPVYSVGPRAVLSALGDFAGLVVKQPMLPGDIDHGGVLVQIVGSGVQWLSSTNVSGRFDFTHLPQGSYQLSFPDSRYRLSSGTVAVQVATAPASPLPAFIVMPINPLQPVGDFAGRVAKTPRMLGDTDDGGVMVQLTGTGFSLLTSTDAAGQFSFVKVAQGPATLSFPDSHYRSPGGSIAVSVATAAATPSPVYSVVPIFTPPAVASGAIQSIAYGAFAGLTVESPLRTDEIDGSGVMVQLLNASASFLGSTDGAGRFEFAGLPQGQYWLSFPDDRYYWPSGSTTVTVATNPPGVLPSYTIVPFSPGPASGTVTVTVARGAWAGQVVKTPLLFDELDQSGVSVQLLNASDSFTGSSRADGRFDFVGIPQGSYWLSFPDDRYYWPSGSVTVTIATNPPGVLTSYTIVPVYVASGTATGTVTIARGAWAGQVVKTPLLSDELDQSGVSVQLLNASDSFTGSSRADGRFDFVGIPQGQYRVSFPDDRYYWPSGSVTVTIATNPPGVLTSYTIVPVYVASGAVTIARGAWAGEVVKTPMLFGEVDNSGVTVQLLNASDSFTGSSRADGRFDFVGIPQVKSWVSFPDDRYYWPSGSTTVTVATDPPGMLPSYTVAPGAGTDVTAPAIVSRTPADGAIDIASTTLQIVFNENVFASGSAVIEIRRNPGFTLFESIAIPSSQVRVSGSRVEIQTTVPFDNTTGYYVQMFPGTFNDHAGNPNVPGAWNFSDTTPPTITIGSPTVGVATSGPVVFPVLITGAKTANIVPGNVTLDVTGTVNSTATVSVAGSGASWTISVSNLVGDGRLGIAISSIFNMAPSIVDVGGNIGITTQMPWTMPSMVIDNTPPQAPRVTSAMRYGFSSTTNWSWAPIGNDGMGTFRYRFDNPDVATGATQTTSVALNELAFADPPTIIATHTLYVQERDAAGNWSLPGVATFSFAATLGIQTVVGGASGTTDGWATAAKFSGPRGIAVDRDGTIYIADTGNHTIRKITNNYLVTTLAGEPGVPGTSDGVASAAHFSNPKGICVAPSGDLFVTDTDNCTIRKVTAFGDVTTFAGQIGNPGINDGPGAVARFTYPQGICCDAAGNLYVADTGGNTIRKVQPDAFVNTVAGSGAPGSADGANLSATFSGPTGIAVSTGGTMDGTIVVADTNNNTIRFVSPTTVWTHAGAAGAGAFADGGALSARFNAPCGVALLSPSWGGPPTVFVADGGNHAVRWYEFWSIPPANVTTIAGAGTVQGFNDGQGTGAHFNHPNGIAIDPLGRIVILDTTNNAVRIGIPAR